MSVRLLKKWVPIEAATERLKGNMGVFQVADDLEEVIYIGYAGSKSHFGLRGEVISISEEITEAVFVRWEITTGYWSRFKELMMLHQFDYGRSPQKNKPVNLGNLSPN